MTIVWAALTQGALIAIVVAGFNITIIGSGIFNFAQGAFLMGSTFVAYLALAQLHLNAGLAVLFGGAVGVAVGALSERVAVRPLLSLRTVSGRHAELITTVGLATGLAGLVGVIWGYQPLSVPAVAGGNLSLLGGAVTEMELLTIGCSLVLAVGLHVAARHTRLGLACLCASEDRDAAMARGINTRALSLGSFALAGAITGLVGLVVAPVTFADNSLGDTFALTGFVALALGGFGNIIGGFVAAMVVEFIGTFAGRYLGASYDDLCVFAFLILILVIRPHGFARATVQRHV
jgi:branched-chain amino acid transport system permease protein